MNIHINGLNIDISETLRQRIQTKLERISRHNSDVINVQITLSNEKNNRHKAAAQVHLAGKDLHIETIENDTQAAIDVLMDKIDRSVLQHKEKNQHLR